MVKQDDTRSRSSTRRSKKNRSVGLENALRFFKDNEEVKEILEDLCSKTLGQEHLLEPWENADKTSPSVLRGMGQQLLALNKSYPGGLRDYILKARNLLQESKEGVNPMEGWVPSVPDGQAFELGTKEFTKTEKIGIKELGKVGFVLVAGGLGERLGYNGSKVGLPTESTTNTSYLQYYCEYIKSIQYKCTTQGHKENAQTTTITNTETTKTPGISGTPSMELTTSKRESFLPLCIMVSNETKKPIQEMLKKNNCFGLKSRQISFVSQGDGVAALGDSDAKIVTRPSDPFKIVTKPHGHGDIHSLLYNAGIPQKWYNQYGIKWLVIFQDTNGLAFHPLPLMLGVSVQKNLIMNSLTIPRKAKQAIGGIAKLTKPNSKEERTINVEYNQLDPLLRATEEFKDGDVNDETTGFSPFPGNINQLLFRLEDYNTILKRTKGIMPDFVNPKYKDDTKTEFKKPTRLECMMQDFPSVLNDKESTRVGFTQVASELCFSPVKNSNEEGAKLQAQGIAAATALTGEADQYAAFRIMLKTKGVKIEEEEPATYEGITVVPGPAIVFKPDFVCCPGEFNIKFPSPEKVKISARSTLVVRGPGVIIESLDLDGALMIDVDRGEYAVVRGLVIKNDGWVRVPITQDTPEKKITHESSRMKGYYVDRKDSRYIEVVRESSCDAKAIQPAMSDDQTEWVLEETTGCSIFTKPGDDDDEPQAGGSCVVL